MQLCLHFYPLHKLLKLLLCKRQSQFSFFVSFIFHATPRPWAVPPTQGRFPVVPSHARVIFKHSTLKKATTLKSESPSLFYVTKSLLPGLTTHWTTWFSLLSIFSTRKSLILKAKFKDNSFFVLNLTYLMLCGKGEFEIFSKHFLSR